MNASARAAALLATFLVSAAAAGPAAATEYHYVPRARLGHQHCVTPQAGRLPVLLDNRRSNRAVTFEVTRVARHHRASRYVRVPAGEVRRRPVRVVRRGARVLVRVYDASLLDRRVRVRPCSHRG